MRYLLLSATRSPVRSLLAAALLLYAGVAYSTVSTAAQAGVAARTAWSGVYTDGQADRGRDFFLESCAECHGSDLQGGEGKALIGDTWWNDWRESTVDSLMGYVSKNMPFSEDGSLAGTLPAATYVDIVAYLLRSNGFPAGQAELTAASGAGVQIIAKEGPGELPATTLARVVGCLERGASGGWRLVKATRPVRARAPGQVADADLPLGDRAYPLMFVLTPLDRYVGYRMVATGALIGDGGAGGVNVSTVSPVSPTCQ